NYAACAGHEQSVYAGARKQAEDEHKHERRGENNVYERYGLEPFAQGGVYLFERGHRLIAVLSETLAHLAEKYAATYHREQHDKHRKRHHRHRYLNSGYGEQSIEDEQIVKVCHKCRYRHGKFIPYYKVYELEHYSRGDCNAGIHHVD